MAKDKILVTGSKGLIGKSLKKSLEVLGYEVLGIDHAYGTNHLEYGNIHDTESLRKLSLSCHGIVHLAGVSRVIMGEQNPSLCWRMNVEGTQNILDITKSLPNSPWVIYASSREVYGQQDKFPVKEDASLSPVNIYARSKATAEQLVTNHRKQGFQTAIMRFSNVYGSIHDYADRVIPAFCRAAVTGESIRIDGGHNTFDFTHINDVTDGIVRVIEKLQKKCVNLPTLHLVGGKATSLLEAAEFAKQVSDKPIEFIHTPSRSFDVASFYGDPSLAKEVLDWETTITVQEGIAKLVEDFKVYLANQTSC